MNNDYDTWAEIYDQIYSDLTVDVDFYKRLASLNKDKILEIGCGTGRITIPLAQAGSEIIGIDLSKNMISILRNKIKEADLNISCYEMDMKYLSLNEKFGLIIIPFNGFQSMLDITEQYKTLTSIYKHMPSGGILALDMFNATTDMFDQDKQIWYQVKEIFDSNSNKNMLINHSSKYNLNNQTICTTLMIEEIINNKITKTTYNDFILRFTNRYESEYLFRNVGFTIENLYGNFALDSFNETSEKMIWILRK
ncbi:MAG: hypothetical protein CL751_04575 [Chloroflexi bacterium]|nr:hypothetical protein [Chloroflexota bacterium]